MHNAGPALPAHSLLRDYRRELGAADVIGYNRADVAEAVRRLRPDGLAGILDLVSDAETLTRLMELVRDGGTVVSALHSAPADGSAPRGIKAVNLVEHEQCVSEIGVHGMPAGQTLVAASEAANVTPIDPGPIFQIASGFMAAKHLFTASSLGVFEALVEGPQTLDQLAARLGISHRTARISADAMAALGLIVAEEGSYRNGELAQIFLAGQTPADLRPFLRFWDQISYRRWTALEGSLRRGAAEQAELTAAEGQIFAAGVEAITAGAAHALATAFSWTGHRRLLDVGGGTGSLLLAVLAEHPHMRGTVVEVEPVVSVARERIAATPFAARADVVEADALTDPLPEGHDALLVANLAHLLSPENNRRLLGRLRESAPAGARLLLVDFWTDPSHTNPPFAALMAGEFALFSDEGDVYSEEEVREWLAETGWTPMDRRPLAGPQSLILAEAT